MRVHSRLLEAPRGGALAPPAPPRRATRPAELEGDVYWPPGDGGGDEGGGGGGGGGGDDSSHGGGGEDDHGQERRAETVAFGVTLWMCALAVTFAIVLLTTWVLHRYQPSASPRLPGGVQRRLGFSTLLLLLSSLCVERSRRRIERGAAAAARVWLLRAQLLALAFLLAQASAWQGLFQAGIRPSTSSLGTSFTTLTALHALHILGGLAYLDLARRQLLGGGSRASATLRSCARYWHFLGWIWLVLLLALFGLFT